MLLGIGLPDGVFCLMLGQCWLGLATFKKMLCAGANQSKSHSKTALRPAVHLLQMPGEWMFVFCCVSA